MKCEFVRRLFTVFRLLISAGLQCLPIHQAYARVCACSSFGNIRFLREHIVSSFEDIQFLTGIYSSSQEYTVPDGNIQFPAGIPGKGGL